MKFPLDAVLREAEAYFMGRAHVQKAANKVVRALTDMKIPFAIAGALAINAHGHVRMTDDVDLLLTAAGLAAFKKEWLGRGWVEKFPGSKGVRDPENNVTIDVLLTGEYPGDGKPKPVVFPDPGAASELDEGGTPILKLPVLIELKLASGMTSPDRPRDLDDVIQLIRKNGLPRDYARNLNEYVRPKYDELWQVSQLKPRDL